MNKKGRLRKSEVTDIIGILVSVIVGLIGVYTQSKDPQTGIFMFTVLLGAIILYFLISYPINLIREKVQQINKNSESIEEIRKDLNIIKDKLDFRKGMEELNIRMSTLENLFKMKGKRGAIDPRWVIIIVILILFYLYLKSKGIIQ